MEPLDPDFEYPHHRDIANQLKFRLNACSAEQQFIVERTVTIKIYKKLLLISKVKCIITKQIKP